MLQSMFSGVSGLRTHQRRMDVIGNDIANVNTPGYKQSDVTFKEAFVNTLRAPSPGSPGQQVGLGVQLASIAKDFSGGILMETGLSSNMGISGDGFFVVGEPVAGGNDYYTRAGDFLLDPDPDPTIGSYLINSDGLRLRGVMGGPPAPDLAGATMEDIILPVGTTGFNVGLDGVVYASVGGAPPAVVARVGMARFANNNGLEAIGGNMFRATNAAGIRPYQNPGAGGLGQIVQGYLENSNVDLAKEFSDMIITQRGFQANSKSITTSDEMLTELLHLKR